MKTASSRVTSQGQVSVPAEVRRQLGMGPGAVLEWEVEGDHAVVRRVGSFSSTEIHEAIFDEPPARRSLEELEEGLRKSIRRRHARH